MRHSPRATPLPRCRSGLGLSALAGHADAGAAVAPGFPPRQMHEPSLPARRTRGRCRPDAAAAGAADDADCACPRRSYRDLVKIAVALVIVCGIGGLSLWQWPNMVALYRYLRAPATEVRGCGPEPRRRAAEIPDRIEPGGQPAEPPQTGAAPARSGGAARGALRRGSGRSGRQALRRLGDLAHRDGVARTRPAARARGPRRHRDSGPQASP